MFFLFVGLLIGNKIFQGSPSVKILFCQLIDRVDFILEWKQKSVCCKQVYCSCFSDLK
jgi:hypothetical protein